MTLDGTYRATIDRIEEGLAVLLVESDGETVDERHYPAPELPEDADEGAVCELTFEDDELVELALRPDSTSDRRRRMREKFDSLSRRLGEDGDDGDDGEDSEDGDGGGPSADDGADRSGGG